MVLKDMPFDSRDSSSLQQWASFGMMMTLSPDVECDADGVAAVRFCYRSKDSRFCRSRPRPAQVSTELRIQCRRCQLSFRQITITRGHGSDGST